MPCPSSTEITLNYRLFLVQRENINLALWDETYFMDLAKQGIDSEIP